MSEPIYEGFHDRDDVARQFSGYWREEGPINIDYADIAIAVYDTPPYEGYAFVLFCDSRDGKWYEVNASHCSCYGLEDQWEPEVVDAKELKNRPRYVGYEDEAIQERIRAKVIEVLE